jgi:hypothetical protein
MADRCWEIAGQAFAVVVAIGVGLRYFLRRRRRGDLVRRAHWPGEEGR